MKDSEIIEILATLPVKEIDDLRLMVSEAFHAYFKRNLDVEPAIYWADLLNKALEKKQENRLREYEDPEFTFV